MKPSIGRIVHYTLTETDAEQINRRRSDANKPGDKFVLPGAVIHSGNQASAGDVYPLMITRVWPGQENGLINGQVFLDGNDTLWATSVHEGEGQRTWHWPPRVEA